MNGRFTDTLNPRKRVSNKTLSLSKMIQGMATLASDRGPSPFRF